MEIGNTIKLVRLARGVKQKELAKAIGIDAPYLSAIEHCRKQPSLKLITKIAEQFDCEVQVMIVPKLNFNT